MSTSQRLPRTVVALGLVSFFNDLASEMVVPLIPILLVTVLGAGPLALGLIEGAADALAALLKLWSGRYSDLLGGRRKGLAVTGYALSNLARPLLALAGSWVAVLALRSIDRIGKGVRSAPRDALLVDCTPTPIRAYAFGFQRALDNAGAVGGALLAAAVLTWSGASLAQVILLSAIPGLAAVACLAFGVREPVRRSVPTELLPLQWSRLGVRMRRYLMVLGLFTLARASETFILLRGLQLGMSVVELLLLWAALNFTKALTSTHGGALADRCGRGPLIVTAWLAYALCFLLLAGMNDPTGLWLVTLAYGLCAGLGEGAERAVIADLSTERERGTAFGWYNLVVGACAIPGGVLFGGLWQYHSAAAAFYASAVLGVVAVLLLRWWAWPQAQAAQT